MKTDPDRNHTHWLGKGRMLLALLLASACLAGCARNETAPGDRYHSLTEARAQGLFERGWLPDILPASTTDIRTANNLDTNTSIGEFHFAATDAPAFFARLSTDVPTLAPFANWPEIVDEYAKRKFSSFSYRDDRSTWTFFCEGAKGSCDYAMWMAPSAASTASAPQHVL